MNLTDIQTGIGKWRVQMNPYSCQIIDEADVPAEFHIPQPDKIDKAAILRQFKATGELLPALRSRRPLAYGSDENDGALCKAQHLPPASAQTTVILDVFGDHAAEIEALGKKTLDIEIKTHREKRSVRGERSLLGTLHADRARSHAAAPERGCLPRCDPRRR